MFTCTNENGLTYSVSPNIDCPHAFTTRLGGVSEGIYSSLNLAQSLGDNPNNVQENYDILCNAIGISKDDIVRSKQVHGRDVRIVTETDRCKLFPAEDLSNDDTPAADGLITNRRNVALIVYTADCVPILLYDPSKQVIGAVHSGWRGTVQNIVGNAVHLMNREFGCLQEDIMAAIGPCISKCCFETRKDVPDALYAALGKSAENCIKTNNDKYMIDLKEANRLMLIDAKVKNIIISDECTSCLADKYWSHRRSGIKRGSQASIIALGESQ